MCIFAWFTLSDGIQKCGLFCCADYVIDQLTHEQQVDVFSSVQQIRRAGRPEFIVSAAQYRCLHDVAASHISIGGDGAEARCGAKARCGATG